MDQAIPGLTIEPIDYGDLGEWIAWRGAVLADVFGPQDPAALSVLLAENERYMNTALGTGETLAVFATYQGLKVGCGSICFQAELPSPDNPTGHCAYLMNIYVRPEYRRHGFGKALVNWLVNQAQMQGVTKIYLESTVAAKPMYRSVGFVDMPDFLVYTGGVPLPTAPPEGGGASPMANGYGTDGFGMAGGTSPVATSLAGAALGAASGVQGMTPGFSPQPLTPQPAATAPATPTPHRNQLNGSPWANPIAAAGVSASNPSLGATASMAAIAGDDAPAWNPSPRPDSSQPMSYLLTPETENPAKAKPLSSAAVISLILSLFSALAVAVPFLGLESYLAFITGNEWLFFVVSASLGVLGIIFGIVALVNVNKKRVRGRGIALAGLVIGAIACIFIITLWTTAASQPSLFDFDVSGFYSLTTT